MSLTLDPSLGIYAIIVLLVGLFVLRIPAGFIMAIIGLAGAVLTLGLEGGLALSGLRMWSVLSSYDLTVIPMFILLGELVYHAGYSDKLYRSTYTWFGHHRGGLAMTTIFASAGFSAICGSNTATAATMSAVAIPSMREYDYHPTLRAGSVAAGATLGVMIPPSIVLVVYGLYAQQSVGKLFFGTLVPGLLLSALMALTVWIICLRHPEMGPQGRKGKLEEASQSHPAGAGHAAAVRHYHDGPVHRLAHPHRGGGDKLLSGLHHVPGPAPADLEGAARHHRRHPAHHLHGVFHHCRVQRVRPVYQPDRPAQRDCHLDWRPVLAGVGHPDRYPVVLCVGRVPDGRAGVSAGLASHLPAAGEGNGTWT